MTRYVIRLDGAGAPVADDGGEVVELVTSGSKRNVLIEPDEYVNATMTELPPRLRDLFVMAGALYAADARVRRGTLSDAFNDAWRRTFLIHLRVHDPAFWNRNDVRLALCETVEFLTGDSITFAFEARSGPATTAVPPLPMDLVPPRLRDSDVVLLLSGGLDSLAAALQARANGRFPLLVSHRPATVLKARQDNVVRLLREHDHGWAFPHTSVLLTANIRRRAAEFSQRSRAFLFGSLGAVAAHLCQAHELRLCDNGVVSLNLAPSGQCVGTTLSRSTHPGYLLRLQRLLCLVLDDPRLVVSNPLQGFTKREVVEMIASLGTPAMIQEAVSCTHPEGRTKGQPHCGLCTQCIDRRFATVAAGLQQHDLSARYEHDIFTASLREGRDRTHAENYVRFAHELRGYDTATAFGIERVPDLADAIPEEGADGFVREVYELLQRHQRDVHAVLEAEITLHAAALACGQLPEHCLLRLTGASDVTIPPKSLFVDRLARILAASIPATFQHAPPANETAMQDAGKAALVAADERLDREAPQVPFGTVSVRPDFSDISTTRSYDETLFVEFKLAKTKKDRNRLHAEIAADLTEYPRECWLLFVVYDMPRAVRDDQEFTEAIEGRRERVRVQIVR